MKDAECLFKVLQHVRVLLAEAACCICERGNCLLRMRSRWQWATCVGYVCGANGQIYRQTRLMLQLIKRRLVRDGPNSSEDTACWCQLWFAASGSSPQLTPAWSVFRRIRPISDYTTLIATLFVTIQKALGVSSNNLSPSNPQR